MSNVRHPYIKISGLILLVLSTILISLAFFLPRLIDVNSYRAEIIEMMQHALNRKVTFSRGEFSMNIGPSFTFQDVTIKEPGGASDFIAARRITLHLALLPLLEKKVVLRDASLEGAEVHLQRNSNGKLSIDDLLQPGSGSFQIHLKKIQIKKGTLHWRDMAISSDGLTAAVQNINLTIDNVSRGHKGDFKLSCQLPGQQTPATVSLAGTLRLPSGTAPLTQAEINGNVNLKHVDPDRFWPYYGKYIPFGKTGGLIDLSSSFKGKLREFNARGKLKLAGVTVVWPTVFHHPVNPRQAQLEYDLKLGQDQIDIPSVNFSADGFKIKGSCKLSDIRSPDLQITAKGTTEPFRLEGLRQWIPYGIIAKDAADYIEEHIMGGTYTLETGTLDGRVSQIMHMEQGTNYNVLHIKGRVEKGIVSYGPKVPAFANIKAGLEMLGKDFIISQASGTFGESPFKMEGRITDYPLDTPCTYPFQMEMTPRTPEVHWLARLAGASKLNFSGNSLLHLKGSGLTVSYNLSGDWELKQAAYTFPGYIRKPLNLPNHLAFSAILGPADTRLTSLSYSLPPLNMSLSAQLKHGKEPHLAFELQTNQFLMSESLPIFTQWQSHAPYGKVQAHIIGSGNPQDFTAMDYSGAITLAAFAFQPARNLKPVSSINGTVNFRGSSLETSNIAVRYGSSQINAKGRIRSFKNPEAEIILASPEFFLKDVMENAPRENASIHRLQAALIIRDDRYTLRNLSGQFNASGFTATGIYTGGNSPALAVSLHASQLDLDDLLAAVKGGGQGRQTGIQVGAQTGQHPLDLKLDLSSDTGHYGKLQFSNLNATLSRDGGIVYLQKLETGIYGGKLSASGRIGATAGHGGRYDLKFNLEHTNAERLFQALDVSREVTGTLSLDGDITASGENFSEIKQNALGNIRLHLEKGKLRKFNVLSKVFSILNFSQLLKFQLPDMVSGGMPYTSIKGSFAVRDGVVATQDLFIRGDALNISVVGSADVVKEELKCTIGVQPLQTVDKVVNRIPVVGWLLTGKDKAFLTAYFEARGKWSNPQVDAIPVKSMAKGVQNVFRRVFELPMRLFTDTGEVMLGQ